jgi:primosomal protein N' (replication factor Y) (superfamily II helicase)
MGAPDPETTSAETAEAAEAIPFRFAEVAVPLPMRQSFTYRIPDELQRSDLIGRAVRVPFRGRKLVGVVVGGSFEASRKGLRAINDWVGDDYCIVEEDRALAEWIAEYYGCAVGEAMGLFLPPRPGTRARAVKQSDSVEALLPLDPTAAQIAAIDAVLPSLRGSRFESFVLHGVTGSGKTEVYLRLIGEALELGRSALVLLPEIALTPQTLSRVHERFPGKVAAYHSRLSHGERCAVWEAAARGEIPVVVGPRSAGFVPRPKLGLIVVDEEHDSSYKAEDRPRYHARDVALWRGQRWNIPVVLGSATPSLESWQNAVAGKHRRLRLADRVGGGAGLPTVDVLDRREDENKSSPLSPRLVDAIEGCLGRGEQAIVFHNRRGFARWMQCHECGEVLECPRCDISLTYHLRGERLHCHYCGHEKPAPLSCPSCEAGGLRQHGAGTQRVEIALETLFPQARVLRLDQDSTGRKHSHQKILDAFENGEADLLVGTQMVAKGLHFPRVTLVGVIDADVGLHFPDFRAHERSFALLTQVAGRSGRTAPGRVIVQTYDPEHRVLESARHHDVEGFFERELVQRRQLSYPPFGRLCAVLVTAPTKEQLDAGLDWLAQGLQSILRSTEVALLGPAHAMLPRINRRYRGQIVLKGAVSAAAKGAILDLFDELKARPRAGRLDLHLDVDPQHLL